MALQLRLILKDVLTRQNGGRVQVGAFKTGNRCDGVELNLIATLRCILFLFIATKWPMFVLGPMSVVHTVPMRLPVSSMIT